MENKEFYTAEELAEKLRVNIMTIYRYIKAGKLKAYKFGKEFRIDQEEFNRFLEKAKMPKCPKCNVEIKSLIYSETKDIWGSASIDESGDMEFNEEYDICEEQKPYIYSCPECNKKLFDDDEEAEEFLKDDELQEIMKDKLKQINEKQIENKNEIK